MSKEHRMVAGMWNSNRRSGGLIAKSWGKLCEFYTRSSPHTSCNEENSTYGGHRSTNRTVQTPFIALSPTVRGPWTANRRSGGLIAKSWGKLCEFYTRPSPHTSCNEENSTNGGHRKHEPDCPTTPSRAHAGFTAWRIYRMGDLRSRVETRDWVRIEA